MTCNTCNGRGIVSNGLSYPSTVCINCEGSGIENPRGIMHETQKTINEWAIKTFGPVKNKHRSVHRMIEEVKELEDVCNSNDINDMDKVSNECADILITLYQVATTFGFDLHACVDHKMQINRARKWKLNGDGTGQHEE